MKNSGEKKKKRNNKKETGPKEKSGTKRKHFPKLLLTINYVFLGIPFQ